MATLAPPDRPFPDVVDRPPSPPPAEPSRVGIADERVEEPVVAGVVTLGATCVRLVSRVVEDHGAELTSVVCCATTPETLTPK